MPQGQQKDRLTQIREQQAKITQNVARLQQQISQLRPGEGEQADPDSTKTRESLLRTLEQQRVELDQLNDMAETLMQEKVQRQMPQAFPGGQQGGF